MYFSVCSVILLGHQIAARIDILVVLCFVGCELSYPRPLSFTFLLERSINLLSDNVEPQNILVKNSMIGHWSLRDCIAFHCLELGEIALHFIAQTDE